MSGIAEQEDSAAPPAVGYLCPECVPGAPDDEGSDGAVPGGLVYAGEDIFAAKVEAKTAFISCAPTQIRTKWISG